MHTEVLDNGLKLMIHADHRAPVVTSHLWFGVGSVMEEPGEEGLAHVMEHMLFKGTHGRGVGEIAYAIESKGGDINAYTTFDQTVYHCTLPSQELKTSLQILADMVCCASLEKSDLEPEIQVIIEEIRGDHVNPGRHLVEQVFKARFSPHPYGRPVAGTKETVKAQTISNVKNFYKRWYTPHNATLIIVGDVDVRHTKKMVQQYFGSWKGRKHPSIKALPSPTLRLPHIIQASDELQEAFLMMAYPIPGLRGEDIPALDLASMILAQGESSRLDQRLRQELGIVSEIEATTFIPTDYGMFSLQYGLEPDKLASVIKATNGVIEELTQSIYPWEIQKAKTLIESDRVYPRETFDGIAQQIGFFNIQAANPSQTDYETWYFDKLGSCTDEDVSRVIKKYFAASKCILAALIPKEYEKKYTKSWLKKTLLQKNKASKAQKIHKKTTTNTPVLHQCKNGMKLIVKPNPGSSIISMRATLAGGLLYENTRNNGVTYFMMQLLAKGTESISGDALSKELDSMAASIDGFSERNSFGISGTCMSRDKERFAYLFSQCLKTPTFPANELELERYIVQQQLLVEDDHIAQQLTQAFQEALYPKHPYGMRLYGNKQSVKSMKRSHIVNHYAHHLNPKNLILSMVGDFEVDWAVTRMEELFGAWSTSKRASRKKIAAPRLINKTKRIHIDSEKEQAQIIVGYPGCSMKGKDKYVLEVINMILSGQSGRLFMSLRDRRGLAYDIYSSLFMGFYPGYMMAYMGTHPDHIDKGVQGIKHEFEKLCQQPVTQKELKRAKNSIVGDFAVSLQRNNFQSITLGLDYMYGLGINEMDTYIENINLVSIKDVQRIAKKYFKPNKAIVISTKHA